MKPMTFDDDTFMKILDDFQTFLKSVNSVPDKINYSKNINAFLTKPEKAEDKVKLYFNVVAYMKMMLLTKDTNDEVGWHGIVERRDEKSFLIKDIVVFPQIVTGATVTPDADEYAMWTMQLDDDTFNHMRFHGHSHVKMGVSPSGVDANYRDDMLANLGDNDFYIFLITNYDEKRHIEIYDKATNTIYETEDISVFLCSESGEDIMAWVKTQEELVKKRTYQTTAATTTTTTTPTNTTPGTGHTVTDKVVKATGKGTSKKDNMVESLEEAYWDYKLKLWVSEDKFGNKHFCMTPPKKAIINPENNIPKPNETKANWNENPVGRIAGGRGGTIVELHDGRLIRV